MCQNGIKQELFQNLTHKSIRMSPLINLMRILENNIRKDCKEIGVNRRKQNNFAQGMDYGMDYWRNIVNATLNLGVP